MLIKVTFAFALVVICSAPVAAATIISTPAVFSAEGVANESLIDMTSFQPVVKVGLNGGYQVGDKVVFSFPNDEFDLSNNAKVLLTGASTGVATFSAPEYNKDSSISFTITSVTTPIVKDDQLILSDVMLATKNIANGGSIALDYKVISSVSNAGYDKVSANIATVEAELSASASAKLDGIIDVNASRLTFEGGAKLDVLKLKVIRNLAITEKPVTMSQISYTVIGDFSFLDTDRDGVVDYMPAITGTSTAQTAMFSKDLQSFSFSDMLNAPTDTTIPNEVTVTIEATDGTTIVPVQAFTANAEITYQPATAGKAFSTKTIEGIDSGSWTLNGASIQIPYMPYASNIEQIIYVSNTSKLAGEVEVLVTADDGVQYHLGQIAVANTGVTKIGHLIKAALVAQGFSHGKASIQVSVNAASDNVQVHASFNVGGADTGFVATK